MSKQLVYWNWDDLEQVEQDVIHAIDEETIYAEDLDQGLIKITIEYVGKTWDEDLSKLTAMRKRD